MVDGGDLLAETKSFIEWTNKVREMKEPQKGFCRKSLQVWWYSETQKVNI